MKLSKLIKDLEYLQKFCGDIDPEVEGFLSDMPRVIKPNYLLAGAWMIRFPIDYPQPFKIIIEFTKGIKL